jgi:hypothetical protein
MNRWLAVDLGRARRTLPIAAVQLGDHSTLDLPILA